MFVRISCTKPHTEQELLTALTAMLERHADANHEVVYFPDSDENREKYDAFIVILSNENRDRVYAALLIAENFDNSEQRPIVVLKGKAGEDEALRGFFNPRLTGVPWYHHFPGIGLPVSAIVELAEKALFPEGKK